jgi:hypothetical protein
LIAANTPRRRHCATRGDRRWLDTVVYALLADQRRALARVTAQIERAIPPVVPYACASSGLTRALNRR